MQQNSDPHANQPASTAGPTPEKAAATLILIHGRGANAESMLGLFDELGIENLAAIAPQAAGHSWYPNSFLAPLESNEPYLDSAVRTIEAIITALLASGIPSEKVALLGFSQGGCLALEYVARHPRRYGAVMGLTGGLIGPSGTPRNYPGSLNNTQVFLGAGDPDSHVPFARVQETQTVLTRMGANVDLRRYPGQPHTINQDELVACRSLLNNLVSPKQDTHANR